MVRTLEQILEIQLGKMQLHIASLMSQMEAAHDEVARLSGRVRELEAMANVPGPTPNGRKPRQPRSSAKEVVPNG